MFMFNLLTFVWSVDWAVIFRVWPMVCTACLSFYMTRVCLNLSPYFNWAWWILAQFGPSKLKKLMSTKLSQLHFKSSINSLITDKFGMLFVVKTDLTVKSYVSNLLMISWSSTDKAESVLSFKYLLSGLTRDYYFKLQSGLSQK